ncbi:hypothetical protein [Leifsonia sp. fls2-241-R2A-40a]|uniref:hypothetical protein n=1 Tax=Leifsonia sp. fls2-241-R2A-40a TaxID=3040290 RepID=UPI00254A7015|nr:hypothetical protein [Leifsonia sp. fls2-241-R2A-40a]
MSWRIGIRILLWETAIAILILAVFWWMPMTVSSDGKYSRGALAPFLFAALFFLLGAATFVPPTKKSRSDAIMERARELHALRAGKQARPPRWPATLVLLLASTVLIGCVTALLVAGPPS